MSAITHPRREAVLLLLAAVIASLAAGALAKAPSTIIGHVREHHEHHGLRGAARPKVAAAPATSSEYAAPGTGIQLGMGTKITEFNFDTLLEEIADPSTKEIILTVLDLPENFANGQITVEWIKNWLHHLNEVHMAHIAWIIGANYYTCRILRQGLIPCYEDTSGWLQENKKIPQGRHTALKWYYLNETLGRGFHALYMDTDTVVFKDPIAAWDRTYDFSRGCKLYEHGGTAPIDSLIKPCMSSALMYARATPSAQTFASSMVTMISNEPTKWEQQLLQEVVLAFTFGEGDSPVLRSRTLPIAKYCNYPTMELRKRQQVPVDDMVIMHMGHVEVGRKRDAAYHMGKWSPDRWNMGRAGRARADMILNATGVTAEERADAWLNAIRDSADKSVRTADAHLRAAGIDPGEMEMDKPSDRGK